MCGRRATMRRRRPPKKRQTPVISTSVDRMEPTRDACTSSTFSRRNAVHASTSSGHSSGCRTLQSCDFADGLCAPMRVYLKHIVRGVTEVGGSHHRFAESPPGRLCSPGPNPHPIFSKTYLNMTPPTPLGSTHPPKKPTQNQQSPLKLFRPGLLPGQNSPHPWGV